MSPTTYAGYNERLFSGGLRSRLHYARFDWFASEMKRRGCKGRRVLELGCFDGKLLRFLPTPPERYVGFDANWEGGLDIARQAWQDWPNVSFRAASRPEDMALGQDEVFDVAVAMETLEHMPPRMVDGYLAAIASHLDGHLFITVPNEKGLLFLMKWLAKKFMRGGTTAYSFMEVVNASLGRMQHVARNEHKGFDYAELIQQVRKHFDVVAVSGHPLGFLPRFACFGIGIVAVSRVDKICL